LLADMAGVDPSLDRRSDQVAAAITDWTIGQDKHVLADRLANAGIPAEPVADGRDVFTDPELIAGGHFVAIDHPVLGQCDMLAPPARFANAEVVVGPPPMLGGNNRDVFVGMLGMDEAEVVALEAEGALA